jgi:WD40 repeat protein
MKRTSDSISECPGYVAIVCLYFLVAARCVAAPPEPVRTFELPNPVTALALAGDGSLAAGGGEATSKGPLVVWSIATGGKKWSAEAHDFVVSGLAFSPDEKLLVSGSFDRRLTIWEGASGKQVLSFKSSEPLVEVFFLRNDLLAYRHGGEPPRFLRRDGEKLAPVKQELTRKMASADLAVSSPTGKVLVTATGNLQRELTVISWDVDGEKELSRLTGRKDSPASLALSRDASLVAFAYRYAEDHDVVLWSLAKNKELAAFSGHKLAVHALAFSPDGKFLVSGSYDGMVKLWNLATNKEQLTFPAHTNSVEHLIITHDGRYLVSGSFDKSVKVWDFQTLKKGPK